MKSLFDDFSALSAARDRSTATLDNISRVIHGCDVGSELSTVAIAGSIGRLEQTAHSDVDLIVITRDPTDESCDSLEIVDRSLAELGIRRPKSGGIFSRPIAGRQLSDPSTLGVIDEDIRVFGVRMHLLLEARPVLGGDAFHSETRGVLDRFVDPQQLSDRETIWRPLLDDLIRYHRSLCARYRYVDRHEPTRAAELKLKSGYSRLINVAGLLFLLGESLVADEGPVVWVEKHLAWTPLERIANVMRSHGDSAWKFVFAAYDRFLAALQSDEFRTSLTSGHRSEELRALEADAIQLKQDLVSFLLDRTQSGDWPRSFLEQVIL